MSDPFESVIAAESRLRQIYKRITVAAREAGADLSGHQAFILANLTNGCRAIDIQKSWHGSNSSYNLKQLVETGLVSQQSAPRDGRATVVKRTAKGERVAEAIRSALSSALSSEAKRELNIAA